MSFWSWPKKPVEVAAPITLDTSEIVAGLEKQLQAEKETVGRLVLANRALKAENAELRAELAAMKAKRDQQTRNLKQFRKVG